MRDQADAAATDDWFATLDAILNPAAVAVVGASRDPDKTGGRILNSIKNGGYQGRVIAVNPRYESVGGWPCDTGPCSPQTAPASSYTMYVQWVKWFQ